MEKGGVIYVVGMGPGKEEAMTGEAIRALEQVDVIVGYPVYLRLLGPRFSEKEMLSTPMKQEIERCRMAYREAEKGKSVAMLCSGDSGVYGMASLLFSLLPDHPGIQLQVIPGVTAALSGAALLGAPINHDFCVISLSDLLTPWDRIEKRLRAAAEGDFGIVLYNPGSHSRREHLRRACDILLERIEPDRLCGIVENIGREGQKKALCTLSALREQEVNMFTTVFIGNSQTREIEGWMVTNRGYSV